MATNIVMNPETFGESSAVPPQSSHNQFTILAKKCKGKALIELVKQVLESPGVHVFGELLSMPNIKELENTQDKKYLNTLNLFAYGTYKDYTKNPSNFLELSPVMKKKLQHLTIVAMAIKSKCIPYLQLLSELEMTNVRALEDLIIEAIYADIIHGKLDQKNKQLEIDFALGRDIRPDDIQHISETLQEWCKSCETVLGCIEVQINKANTDKANRLAHQKNIEMEIIHVRKNLRTMQDQDDIMQTDSREQMQAGPSSGIDPRKRSLKSKQGRPSGKSWFKFSQN
ncbi:COPS7B family protein [Megaselia abdita]